MNQAYNQFMAKNDKACLWQWMARHVRNWTLIWFVPI
jgi:hypothetical protein